MKQVFSLLMLLCTFSILQAQQNKFKYKANVNMYDITHSGVYKIALEQAFTAKSTSRGLYDVRLVDESGKFIAYGISHILIAEVKPVFVEFPEVKQNTVNDTATVYIAKYDGKPAIGKLWLKLKNTTTSRLLSLSGSDDLKHWYAIKEDVQLQSADSDNENTEYEQMLNFPVINYHYFRVIISNNKKDFVKVTHMGQYVADSIPLIEYEPAPPTKLSRKDGYKQTSYFVDWDNSYLIDAIHIDIDSPQYYRRHITIYDVGDNRETKLCETTVSSSLDNTIYMPMKTNRLRIDVQNGDDNPIKFSGITASSLRNFAVAYLAKGHLYYLLTGDSSAKEVSYDLTFMNSKPMLEFTPADHSAVYKNPAYGKLAVKVTKDYTQLIWISIAVVLILLSLLTWRMVKELGAK
jgi:hypothetical protein